MHSNSCVSATSLPISRSLISLREDSESYLGYAYNYFIVLRKVSLCGLDEHLSTPTPP